MKWLGPSQTEYAGVAPAVTLMQPVGKAPAEMDPEFGRVYPFAQVPVMFSVRFCGVETNCRNSLRSLKPRLALRAAGRLDAVMTSVLSLSEFLTPQVTLY